MLTLRFCRCLPAAGRECCLEGNGVRHRRLESGSDEGRELRGGMLHRTCARRKPDGGELGPDPVVKSFTKSGAEKPRSMRERSGQSAAEFYGSTVRQERHTNSRVRQ